MEMTVIGVILVFQEDSFNFQQAVAICITCILTLNIPLLLHTMDLEQPTHSSHHQNMISIIINMI
jgi:hypothetical protein